LKAFDLDTLHEHNLKIFGDVFESLIGAVFLDSQSVEKTWEILEKLISPYVEIYANLDTLQDHSRTLLLEMWN
jgi:dsRNA-specific ribonuclease